MMSAIDNPNSNRWYVVDRPWCERRMCTIRHVDAMVDTDPVVCLMTPRVLIWLRLVASKSESRNASKSRGWSEFQRSDQESGEVVVVFAVVLLLVFMVCCCCIGIGGVSHRGQYGGCQIGRPAVWEINGYHHLVVAWFPIGWSPPGRKRSLEDKKDLWASS